MLVYIVVENIGEMSCWIEEEPERARNSTEISTISCRNNYLSFAMVIVIYVPYEIFLYDPSVCSRYFTYSPIISKSGSEFLHIYLFRNYWSFRLIKRYFWISLRNFWSYFRNDWNNHTINESKLHTLST